MNKPFALASILVLAASPATSQTRRAPAHPAAKATPKAAPTAPKPPAAPPKLYDFKGVALETTLDDFRKLPHPDGTAAKVICTGEKPGLSTYESEPVDVMVFDSVEKSLGVIKCQWIETESKYLKGSAAGLGLAASGYATNSYSFSFIKDPKDGAMRLFKYEGESNVAVFGAVVDALTTKWGKPVTVNGTVQNKMGASFDQSTSLWTNPLASISVQSRYTKIDNIGILMIDTRLDKIVSDARDAKKAATPNAI